MATDQQSESSSWNQEQKNAFRDISKLLEFLNLDFSKAPFPLLEKSTFPILVPHNFAKRMAKNDWNDPLLLQVLPLQSEKIVAEGYANDPVGDIQATVAPGLIHKYRSRVLLALTPACAIHCRYCFRKEYPYETLPKSKTEWQLAWEYINSHPEISEVILSGGDPLLVSNSKLQHRLEMLAEIKHIKTIRFHTRTAVVQPSRIDQGLLDIIKETAKRFKLITVLHVNHPKELQGDCMAAIEKLLATDMLLFNQAVLLKGVNDDLETQVGLAHSLIDLGIIPYYLHQLDKVTGTQHFEVSEKEASKLWEKMKQTLPGYALPRFVQEIAGIKYKVRID